MRSWFGRRSVPADAVATSDSEAAYQEGRLDERRRVDRDVADAPVEKVVATEPRVDRRDLDTAYERGRLDERRRRRGSPLLGFIVLIIAVVGGLIIYLTIRTGSVGSAGTVVDRNISTVAQKAQAPLRGAEDKAGNALQNAGQTLKQNAGSSPP